MGPLAAGQVVLIPFPFSDLSRSKLRPALLLAPSGRNDWIACQITSNPYGDPRAITLYQEAFAEGSLQRVSYVRPGKLFTAHESLVVAIPGTLGREVVERIRDSVIAVIREERL